MILTVKRNKKMEILPTAIRAAARPTNNMPASESTTSDAQILSGLDTALSQVKTYQDLTELLYTILDKIQSLLQKQKNSLLDNYVAEFTQRVDAAKKEWEAAKEKMKSDQANAIGTIVSSSLSALSGAMEGVGALRAGSVGKNKVTDPKKQLDLEQKDTGAGGAGEAANPSKKSEKTVVKGKDLDDVTGTKTNKNTKGQKDPGETDPDEAEDNSRLTTEANESDIKKDPPKKPDSKSGNSEADAEAERVNADITMRKWSAGARVLEGLGKAAEAGIKLDSVDRYDKKEAELKYNAKLQEAFADLLNKINSTSSSNIQQMSDLHTQILSKISSFLEKSAGSLS